MDEKNKPQTFKTMLQEEYDACIDAKARLMLAREAVRALAELFDLKLEDKKD